jgi:hypothetical protein
MPAPCKYFSGIFSILAVDSDKSIEYAHRHRPAEYGYTMRKLRFEKGGG